MVTKKPKGLGRGLEALLGPTVHEGADADYLRSFARRIASMKSMHNYITRWV